MKRTTIHDGESHSGNLHVDTNESDRIYLHMDSGGFSHCLSLSAADARKMAEALLKGAYAIEARMPQAEAEAA